jgi:uncharacterized protein (TIGR02328 family)
MRIWSWQLLPYLPDAQFKGQLRELVAIMHDWRDKGTTNHLLINRVMEYPKSHLSIYYARYIKEYKERRPYKFFEKTNGEFMSFGDIGFGMFVNCEEFEPFNEWHNKEYLRVCMANLYEKHFFGVGKSRITDEEWQRLLDGYKTITGEEYQI